MTSASFSMDTLFRFDQSAEQVSRRLRAGTAVVRARGGGAGAGAVWSADGLVITNHHVVADDEAEVVVAGRGYPARVAAREPGVDLAALRLEADALPALPVGDSTALRPGQLVLAVGNPHGETGAVTTGIISRTGRLQAGPLAAADSVQANITLRPGNSGGPLADAEGRVVGINSMVLGPGVAVAVAAHTVQAFLARHAPGGPVVGIAGQVVPLDNMVEGHGILVTEVAPASAAEHAGLTIGDVLLTLDGAPLPAGGALGLALSGRAPGEPRRLGLLRGGRRTELTVIPRAREQWM